MRAVVPPVAEHPPCRAGQKRRVYVTRSFGGALVVKPRAAVQQSDWHELTPRSDCCTASAVEAVPAHGQHRTSALSVTDDKANKTWNRGVRPQQITAATGVAGLSERAQKNLQRLREMRLQGLKTVEESPPTANLENLDKRAGPSASSAVSSDGATSASPAAAGIAGRQTAPAQAPAPAPPQLRAQNNRGTVSRTAYDQLSASRTRLSKQISEKNQYIRFLEDAMTSKDAQLAAAADALAAACLELGSLDRLATTAAAAVCYSVSKDEGIAKLGKLRERLHDVQQGLERQRDAASRRAVRAVPVAWYGPASEVRVMGDFDSWTRGQDLSVEEVTDAVFSKFEADLKLLPGEYRIKFQVDGEWRLAPDWPTETDENGDTNNILVVD